MIVYSNSVSIITNINEMVIIDLRIFKNCSIYLSLSLDELRPECTDSRPDSLPRSLAAFATDEVAIPN